MSEEPKPCPFCGCEHMKISPNIHTQMLRVQCEGCWATSVTSNNRATIIAAWNRRASSTPPTTECEGDARKAAKRIVDWDDGGRLADDEWLVERNETAIIAICRALLSSPRVEDVRREALEEAAKVATNAIDSMKARQARRPGVEISALLLVADRIYQGIRSLSLPDGEGKEKLATRAEDGPTAPTDR